MISNQLSKQNALQMVKPDPTRKMTLNKRVMSAASSLQICVFITLNLLGSSSRGTGVPPLYWFYLIGMLLIFFLQFPSRRERQAWKRQEQRCQLAAQGDREQVTLATVQPSLQDASEVPLPIILRAKNRFPTIVSIFAMFLVMVIFVFVQSVEFILFSAWLDLSISHVNVTFLLLIVSIPLDFLLLFCGIHTVLAIHHDSQQLQFTETGFLRCTRKKVTVVPWEEARLFAIVPASPDMRKTSGPPTMYELSSTNEVLRWSTSKHMALFAGQAKLTSREHRQQMQALLSVIAAKTNLPLYDLR